MKIELTISEEIKSIDEFINSISRENSQFTIWKHNDEAATIYFNNVFFSGIAYMVKGVIDKSVLNTTI
jgi:hypothetical protein